MTNKKIPVLPGLMFVAGILMIFSNNQLDIIGWLLLALGCAIGLVAGYVQGYARSQYRAQLISRATMLLWRIGSLAVLIPIRLGLAQVIPGHLPTTGVPYMGQLFCLIGIAIFGRSMGLASVRGQKKPLES